jgi:hypothetical protein
MAHNVCWDLISVIILRRIIKDDKMVRTCSTHEKTRNLCKLLIRTLEERGHEGVQGIGWRFQLPSVNARIGLNWRKPVQCKMFTKTVMGMNLLVLFYFSITSIWAMGPLSASHSVGTGTVAYLGILFGGGFNKFS